MHRGLVSTVALIVGAALAAPAEESEAALRRMVAEAVEEGERPVTYVDLLGRRMRGIVRSADERGMSVIVLGQEVMTAWTALDPRGLLRLARKCARERGENYAVLARYARDNDLKNEALEQARKAAELDPSFREEASALERSLAPRKPALPVLLPAARKPPEAAEPKKDFDAVWVHASATSAVIYWRLGEMSDSATSYVEYGADASYGRKTPATGHPRWAQFHRITGLVTGAAYHYRMVVVRGGVETRSADATFATGMPPGARALPGGLQGPPYVLSARGVYVLTRDVTAPGTAFEIAAPDVTLDLDGHTVVFGDDTGEQAHGVLIRNEGRAMVSNGHIVQGRRSKRYSSGVESRWRARPTEIFGVSTDVHLPCAYPVRMFGRCADTRVHHNLLYSRVTEIECRHYPGNDILRVEVGGDNVEIFDNILTEGCHVGLRLSGGKGVRPKNVEAHHNDIRHHQQYVNGYALACSCPGADVHHNKVTSVGRTVHLTREGILLHDNHFDTKGHWHLDDMPPKSRPWQTRRVELHGIKFEGRGVRNCRIYRNFMRITQKLPVDSGGVGAPEDKIVNGVYLRSKITSITAERLEDATQNWERDRWKGYHVRYSDLAPPALITGSGPKTLSGKFAAPAAEDYTVYAKWDYVPATPLNVACYDPNAMNEVYENTFVALTEYGRTRHGGYGDSGQWASSIYFVGMKSGPAEEGRYSIYVHDNRFVSNDLFVSSGAPVNMTVRVERNTFVLATQPPPTVGHKPFRGLGAALTQAIRAGGNVFQGMGP